MRRGTNILQDAMACISSTGMMNDISLRICACHTCFFAGSFPLSFHVALYVCTSALAVREPLLSSDLTLLRRPSQVLHTQLRIHCAMDASHPITSTCVYSSCSYHWAEVAAGNRWMSSPTPICLSMIKHCDLITCKVTRDVNVTIAELNYFLEAATIQRITIAPMWY